jgi:hypothetical protein
MVGDAATNDPSTDDDNLRMGWQSFGARQTRLFFLGFGLQNRAASGRSELG